MKVKTEMIIWGVVLVLALIFALNYKIIFGSGSEIIGGIKAGFNNWVGCEINPDYVEIAKARIDYWTTQDKQLTIFDIDGE